MQSLTKFHLSLSILIFSFCSLGMATDSQKTLTIGTKEAPPFSMKKPDGNWAGISIDLWETIANNLNLKYKFVERTVPELIQDVSTNQLDAAVAALSITSERERIVDFTHPFTTSGLGIAVPFNPSDNQWMGLIKGFFSLAFLKAMVALTVVLFIAGFAVWLFERKKNGDQFGGKPIEGLGAGLWWSAVTMTTVGYGDKSPITFGGRVVGLIWMFTSIIIISGFTAGIASSLTVNKLGSKINGPEDLPGNRVAAIEGTTAHNYLKKKKIKTLLFSSLEDAASSVENGKADALVHDEPLLRYISNNDFNGKLTVVPRTFVRQDYGIALPPKSTYRELINDNLLKILTSPQWVEINQKYLGE